jgi:succinate dehydrogenase hydrophobic anchor subunit
MSRVWRLEALGQLLFYLAAAILLVVLPLHLLEHLPSVGFFNVFKQTARSWVLWLVLIFAGIHGSWGLRSVLLDYIKSPTGRRIATILSLLLGLTIIVIGAYGLASVF